VSSCADARFSVLFSVTFCHHDRRFCSLHDSWDGITCRVSMHDGSGIFFLIVLKLRCLHVRSPPLWPIFVSKLTALTLSCISLPTVQCSSLERAGFQRDDERVRWGRYFPTLAIFSQKLARPVSPPKAVKWFCNRLF